MKWLWIVGILILIAIGFFSFGITQPYSCGFSMHGGPYGMMGFGYGGIIMWIIFLIIIGLVVYLILRNTGFKGFEISDRETPLDILKRRYAQGEITKEEFDNMKKDL
ncbi:hypothetical protein ES703_117792 [subsurface metagenome]|jgi:putative membrane protein